MKRKFLPEDIRNLTFLSYPVLSPDSRRIAWISRKGEEENGLFPSLLHVANARSGERICVLDGCEYRQPHFLKDSSYLLYLSNQSGEFQVYLRNLADDSSCQLTTLRHGVLRYTVNEQETALAFEAILWPEEVSDGTAFFEMSTEEKQKWQEELDYRPYKAEDLTYKMDEWSGMRKGEYSHVGTAECNLSEVVKLLCRADSTTDTVKTLPIQQKILFPENKMESVYPAWSHDGSSIAFYGYPHKGAKGRRAELFVCRANGSKTDQLTETGFIYPNHAPAFTADDHSVICMGFPTYEDGSCLMLPHCISLDDSIEPDNRIRILNVGMNETVEEIEVCHGVSPMIAGRTEMGENGSYFRLSKDGNWIYFLSGIRGKTGLYKSELAHPQHTKRIALPGTTAETDILAFDMNSEEDIIWLGADALHPAELFCNGRQVTSANEWISACELGRTEEFWTKSRDGKADLQWFLVHPAGAQADPSHPAVLYIKGGPETMYAKTFWHEFQALSGAGFTVIYGNPRGSVGFGRAFNAGAVCWMNESMHDLLDMVEDAATKGYVDRACIGVTGGSYGGYMTNKLLGRTDVFAAAVTQRCLVNPATSYGTGDMGFVSAREIPKTFKMLDYLADRAKGNIISYIDNFKAPLLILHGMKDYRCGFEQAEQLFTAMKDRRAEVPVRLVAFPGENHGVSRTGKLYNQIRHLSELVNWFVKYLSKDGEKNE